MVCSKMYNFAVSVDKDTKKKVVIRSYTMNGIQPSTKNMNIDGSQHDKLKHAVSQFAPLIIDF